MKKRIEKGEITYLIPHSILLSSRIPGTHYFIPLNDPRITDEQKDLGVTSRCEIGEGAVGARVVWWRPLTEDRGVTGISAAPN